MSARGSAGAVKLPRLRGQLILLRGGGIRDVENQTAVPGGVRRADGRAGSVTALVSLAEARDRGMSNRKVARKGGDPLAEKRRADAMPTFADATPAWSSRSGPAGAAPSTPGPG